MSIAVLDHVDASREACLIIERLVSGERMSTLREDILRKSPDERDALDAFLSPIEALCAAAEKVVDAQDETVRFLFEQLDAERSGLWDVLYAAQEGTDDALALALLDHLLDDEAPDIPPADEAATIDALLAIDAPQPLLARCLLFYMRRDAYRAALGRIIAPVVALVDAAEKPLMPLIAAQMQAMRDAIAAGSLDAYLAQMSLPVTLNMSDGVKIRPQLVQPSALSLYVRIGAHRTSLMFWGVCIRDISERKRKQAVSPSQLHDFLKVLADETKLEMLRLLSGETMYGAQLAQQLGISAATVSYHMSQLGSMQLVQLTRRENRIYYEVDRARLRVYLDALAETLA